MVQVKIVNKSKNELPKYATEGSAGLDIRANVEDSITLKSLERTIVPTGLFIQLPKGMEAQIRPRSGTSVKNGITVLNSPGTIDSEVILINLSKDDFTINNGDRIAQMIISKHEQADFLELKEVGEFVSTERGSSGFGSTGTK